MTVSEIAFARAYIDYNDHGTPETQRKAEAHRRNIIARVRPRAYRLGPPRACAITFFITVGSACSPMASSATHTPPVA